MLRRFLLALVTFTLLGGAYLAHAQVGTTDVLTLSIDPTYPQPYQVVTVTPDSTQIDLSASTLTFTVNGKVIKQSTGMESAQVAMGGPGTVTTITVTALNNGNKYAASITIHPADVALILEPTSTSHPFYEGASLLGSEGRIRVIAVPDLRTSVGSPIPASNLVYTWKNGEQILQSSSGIGKSVLVATAPVQYRDTVLSVIVSSQDSSIVGQASVLISPQSPFIRIYENDPLLGPLYDTALSGTVSLTDSEATYRAVPYFFNTTPSTVWQVNGTPSQTGPDITVRPTGSGKGTAVLSVNASSGTLGQSVDAMLSVIFGSKGTGIFGL